jgi:hypothetical protein
MMVDQMDMQYQLMLMNEDHLMYEMVFDHIKFQFVHQFLMSIEKIYSSDFFTKFLFVPQILMYYPVNIENEP